MQSPNLAHLKANDRQAVEAFVEALRRDLENRLLLLALFGSKARGDDLPDSDIDFLVVTDGEPRDLERRLNSLTTDTDLEFGVLINTLVFGRERWTDFAGRRAAFWLNAQRDGMLMLRSPRLPDSLVTGRLTGDQQSDHRPEVTSYMASAWQALRTAESEFIQAIDYLVISDRAYYAAFYAANAVLATRGLQSSQHPSVLAMFRQLFVKTGEMEAACLHDYEETLKRRLLSDYDLNSSINADFVRVSLEAAQRFTSRVERYLILGGRLAE
jgi:uncharacterized protein (UPF0332 family)/predicted nucleotidyltransferase